MLHLKQFTTFMFVLNDESNAYHLVRKQWTPLIEGKYPTQMTRVVHFDPWY